MYAERRGTSVHLEPSEGWGRGNVTILSSGNHGSDNERDRVEELGDTLRPSAVNFLGATPFLEIASFIWIFQLLNTGLQFALCR